MCSECGKAIDASYYVVPTTNAPICQECYQHKATVCPVCKSSVPPDPHTPVFRGTRYHVVCYHCQMCNAKFGPEGPELVDGQLWCRNCAAPCAGCGRCLGTPFVSFNGKNYHENCFICSQCKQVIVASGEIGLLGDDPVCAACVQKLQQA